MPAFQAHRYCRQCLFDLFGLTSNSCPECGVRFDPAVRKSTLARPFRPFLLETIISPLLSVAALPATYLVVQIRMIHWSEADILTRVLPLALLLGLAMVYSLRLMLHTGRRSLILLGVMGCMINLLSLWVWFDRFEFLFKRYCLGG